MTTKLNMTTITCEKVKELAQGENNPGHHHGGKISKFSKNFVHGYDADWHQEWAKKHSEFRNDNKRLFKSTIEYWQALYPDDPVQAEEEYKNFQIRDLNYFVEKYGEDEGKKRHQQKIERWAKSMPRFNYSMISQDLFNQIMESYTNSDSDIYYATYERDDMEKYENKEYRLKTKTSYIMPDFVDISKKRIIEFDGDYWHSEAKVNPVREKKRHEQIVNAGFEVIYIREQDYKQDKHQVISECLQFLNK
jgi:very-short-patch-repair endonuclease